MMTFSRTLFAVALLMAAPAVAAPLPTPGVTDPEAARIALRALDAIERGWALARYDQAGRVRATVNLRGTNGLGVTANLALDRSAGRWRLDTAGDVGPLTLWADNQRASLLVPALSQYASRPAGFLAPGASLGRSLTREVATMRQRIEGGYAPLVHRGVETVDGAQVNVIVDTPEPGVTSTYWLDASTDLPRRITIAKAGGRQMRIDFAYARGPRPSTVTAIFPGTREVRLTIAPRYDQNGRVSRFSISGRMPDGTGIDADVNLQWSTQLGNAYFRFSPPSGAQQVSFEQLASGVLFGAAGKLGPLASIVLGTR